MPAKKEFISGIAVLALLVLTITIVFITRYQRTKVIERGKKTQAYVLSVEMHKKPTLPLIAYLYIVNNDSILSSQYVEAIVNFPKLKKIEGKTIPVIYDSTNAKKSVLQLNESDYK